MRFIVGHTRGRATHERWGTPEHRVWKGLRQRCMNPRVANYANYGGRGIMVDPAWDSFEQFLADMGPRPNGAQIDRIDNDGPYSKANCRWATRAQQSRNRRDTRMVEVFGSRISFADACEEFQISQKTVRSRLRYGWNLHNALFAPVR